MKKTSVLTEDWAAVVIGFFIIIVTVWGLKLAAPAFKWADAQSLVSGVLTSDNFLKLLIQFVFVYLIAIAGAVLMGKPVGGIAKSLPVVYILTIIASIAGGYEGIKTLNLETVIFCLFLGLLIRNLVKLPDWFYQSLSSEFL
ncbi:hypothetical protein [Niabella hibiscisoli]|uniref:hypothetical protein n=1 Tax=Niabella hibiscisoli TaxID=1825928 RepID=UPI001F0F5A55|nr:hypothetical protein [Niabella hibiscisoli]MCH5719055.1 hypothetical protein [Niabella hibiscisoli]